MIHWTHVKTSREFPQAAGSLLPRNHASLKHIHAACKSRSQVQICWGHVYARTKPCSRMQWQLCSDLGCSRSSRNLCVCSKATLAGIWQSPWTSTVLPFLQTGSSVALDLCWRTEDKSRMCYQHGHCNSALLPVCMQLSHPTSSLHMPTFAFVTAGCSKRQAWLGIF